MFVLLLSAPAAAAPATETSPTVRARVIQANKLIDYIRGNRSRLVQVTTIGFGLGLLILMTATRKS